MLSRYKDQPPAEAAVDGGILQVVNRGPGAALRLRWAVEDMATGRVHVPSHQTSLAGLAPGETQPLWGHQEFTPLPRDTRVTLWYDDLFGTTWRAVFTLASEDPPRWEEEGRVRHRGRPTASR